MHIVAARLNHETNTFSPVPTPLETFGPDGPTFGAAAYDSARGTRTGLGAFIAAAQARGDRISVAVNATANPSGRVADAAYERFAGAICDAVRAGCDAILLDLHGAMVTQSIDDGEGELLRRIRAIAPATPLAVALDLHGNVTQAMVDHADVIVGFKTYPHVDMFETGAHAARVLFEAFDRGRKPALAWAQPPLLSHTLRSATGEGAMQRAVERAHRMESEGLLAVTVFAGFSLADIPDAGMSVVAVGTSREQAQRAAEQLAAQLWEDRAGFVYTSAALADSVAQACALRARHAASQKPVLLLDHGDNVMAGGTCDTTDLLEECLRQQMRGIGVGPTCDPRVVAAAIEAGVGAQIEMPVGNVRPLGLGTDPRPRLTVQARIRAITGCAARSIRSMRRQHFLVEVFVTQAIDPFATLTELAALLQRREATALELAEFYLQRIARANPKLNAFVTVEAELARDLARASDARRAAGLPLGPLDGMPIALKDLLEIEGRITTVGSALWRDRRSKETAVVVQRLVAEGMVILGKTQMVEFAFGGWGPNPKLGTPWNPWDLNAHRTPGGSSSGSGVAVAAGLAPAAIGSDTGGSVRIPASLNGITGLKTTGGLISLRGAFPLSSTLDSIGPMTRDVDDALLLTAAMAEPARRGALETSTARRADLAGVQVVMLPADQAPIAIDANAQKALDDARRVLVSLGVTFVEKRFPFDFADLMRRNGQLIAAEAYTVHRGYVEDQALPIGPWVRSRLLGGKGVTAADYIDALAHRRAACATWREWMRDADAVLTPTLPMPSCRLEEVDETTTPLAAFTRAANYLDACALSLPAGFSPGGLPVGIQLLGKPFDETLLLDIGRLFQRATDWHRRRPDLAALFKDA